MTRKKNIIMLVMGIAVLVMIIGYAAFATRLTIRGTSNITSLWQVEITSITSSATGEAYNIDEPTYSGPTATFNAGFNKPGDKMTYTVKVENTGTIGAIISDATVDVSGTPAIIYSIEDLQYGIRLGAGESTTFKVISEFDINATEIPEDTSKIITINIVAIQDQDQTLTPGTPSIDQENILTTTILNDNTATADTSINFGAISSDTNGQGLYYTSTNTQNNKKTYYFRGAVTNNYIEFAGITWRIVRINEDGSVRLVTQDNVGTSQYYNLGTSSGDNAYVGYMYGTADSTTYKETHANKNNSTIKTYLDNWYQNNLNNYGDYLKDAGFCNDRSLATTSGTTGINNVSGFYGMFNRLIHPTSWSIADAQPQFGCIQQNDLFTVSSGNGNKALDYPIGLLTIDEVWYAGGAYGTNNTSYYLSNGTTWFTMTPWAHTSANALIAYVNASGNINPVNETNSYGVRPVINIKGDLEVISGDGTSSNPYKVSTTTKNTLVSKVLSSNTVQSESTIDLTLPSYYEGVYVDKTDTTTKSVTFSSSTSYWFADSYNYENGYFELTGNVTSGTWSSMSSSYSTYPYTCLITADEIPYCDTLYKMTGYTSSTAGSAVTYTIGNGGNHNGKGLYATATNTEGNGTTYYFRGDVDNNYVSFAGHLWQIVRINEDGSTRLIKAEDIGKSTFSSTKAGIDTEFGIADNTYMGYMHGDTNATSYEKANTNTRDSVVKILIDDWYEDNLLSYSKYLADAGFCNDRSVASAQGLWTSNDTALGYGYNNASLADGYTTPTGKLTYYGAYNRLESNNQPQFACPQTNDLFTTGESVKGNKALKYPIGLITADEVWYAGITNTKSLSTDIDLQGVYYLLAWDSDNLSSLVLTMTPGLTGYVNSFTGDSSSTGFIYTRMPLEINGLVRPVINLKADVEISSGSGTSSSPYVIKTS